MATATVQNHESHTAMSEKEGKHLTFSPAGEEYGLAILKVRETIGHIEEAPQVGSSVNADFLLDIGRVGESAKILLDIDRVRGGGSGLLAHERSDTTRATSLEHTTEPSERTP